MKSIRLLLKNSFKTAYKNWTQLIGISILITLFAMVVSLLTDISARVIKGYDQLNTSSVLHDFLIEQDNTKNVSINSDTVATYIKENISDDEYQNKYLSELDSIKDSDNQELQKQFLNEIIAYQYKFDWTRTEGRVFNSTTTNGNATTVKAIVKTGSNDGSATTDKINVSKGSYFSSDLENSKREVILGTSYARRNDIKVGDIIRLQKDKLGSEILVSKNMSQENYDWLKNKVSQYGAKGIDDTLYSNYQWFVVKGIGESSDYAFPVIDKTTYIPDTSTQLIAYVNYQNFGLSKSSYDSNIYTYNSVDSSLYVSSDEDREIVFSAKFADSSNNTRDELDKIQESINKLFGYNNFKNIYQLGDSSYTYNSRTQTFNSIINAYTILSRVLLIVIGVLTFITIALMTKKQIDAIRKQVGTLKALGYKKRAVINNFLAAPLINSIIGCLMGYVLTFPVEYIVVSVFSKYFSITFLSFNFQIMQLLLGLFVTYAVNLVMVFISAYAVLNQPALELLNGSIVKQISSIGVKIKKLYAKRKFNTKLRAAIVTSSFGKLIGIVITMFIGSFLMTMSIIAPKVMYDNQKESFEGMNYNSQYIYNSPIASNPLTFYRTYDYNNTDVQDFNDESTNDDNNTDVYDSWGFNENKIGKISFGLSKTEEGYTAYPVKGTNNEIDFDNIVNVLASGEQPSEYYSYNVSKGGDGSEFSNLTSLLWKNISSNYMNVLNNTVYNSGSIAALVAQAYIFGQWADYQTLITQLKNYTNVDSVNTETRINIAKTLQWFYKIYSQGIPLKLNDNVLPIDDNGDRNVNETFINLMKTDNSNLFNNILEKSMNINLEDVNASEEKINEVINNLQENNNNTLAYINDNEISLLSDSDISSLSDTQLNSLNLTLLSWLVSTIEGKVGTALLLNTYSRSPYYVQQEILNSFNEDENYNISFGLIPYDPKTDEIGTVLKTTYKDKSNSDQELYVYGLDDDEKLVTLNNSKGNNLLQELNKTSNGIVINQTLAKKMGYKVGNEISLSVLQNVYNSSDNELSLDSDYNGSWNNETAVKALSGRVTTNSSKSYTNNDAYTNYDTSTNKADFESATLNNVSLSNEVTESSLNSNNPTDIHKEYQDGNLTINETSQNKTFKIVGIQNGYGTAQAWISNSQANSILGYDKTQEYMFINYFLPEWYSYSDSGKTKFYTSLVSSDELTDDFASYNDDIFDTLSTDHKIDENVAKDKYEELLEKKDSDEGYKALWNFFNNQYPVFNYKNSSSSDLIDIKKGVTTIQQLGDYSESGLSGTTYSDDSIKSLSDASKKIDGLSKGAINIGYPLNVKQKILSQITDLVNMVMTMFIVLSIIISIVIILLITNLIIYENKEFIATMKIMGYSEKYVLKMLILIYLVPLAITFVFGFLTGLFTFKSITSYIASSSSWVLPFYITWYIPFAVLGIMMLIFTFTFFISYSNVKKISPIIVLNT